MTNRILFCLACFALGFIIPCAYAKATGNYLMKGWGGWHCMVTRDRAADGLTVWDWECHSTGLDWRGD